MTNSREKGKRGERLWRNQYRENGYTARRGQQYAGGTDSPDVICEELPWIHNEVKVGKRINIKDAIDQAKDDAGDKLPIVAFKYDRCEWNVAMPAWVYFALIRECVGSDMFAA